jgi:hypothetical protein
LINADFISLKYCCNSGIIHNSSWQGNLYSETLYFTGLEGYKEQTRHQFEAADAKSFLHLPFLSAGEGMGDRKGLEAWSLVKSPNRASRSHLRKASA